MRNCFFVMFWLMLVVLVVVLVFFVCVNIWFFFLLGSWLVGQNQFYVVQDDGGLLEVIVKKYNVGFLVLLQVNFGVDFYVLCVGSVLIIFLQMLLFDVLCEGLVINFVELCFYYYLLGKNEVIVYLIGIGQLGGIIIILMMVIIVFDKWVNLIWIFIVNICVCYKVMGIELLVVVFVGFDNLMGYYVICFVVYGGVYFLYGINVDFGIGMCVSFGCICLCDNDIKVLYNIILLGMKVNIINMLIKVLVELDGCCLVEVYQLLFEYIDDDLQILFIMFNVVMIVFKQVLQIDGMVMECVMNYCLGMLIDVICYVESGLQLLQFYVV